MPAKRKTKKTCHEGAGVASTVNRIANKVINMLPSSDANARPGFPNERHAILKLPNGKPGVGNFIGQTWA